MFWLPLLYGTTLACTEKYLKFWIDDFLNQLVSLGGEHRSLWILFQHLNARFVHEEAVVENVEVIVEHTKRISLRHLIALPLPAQPLVVVRVGVCTDVDRLPMNKVSGPFTDVENAEIYEYIINIVKSISRKLNSAQIIQVSPSVSLAAIHSFDFGTPWQLAQTRLWNGIALFTLNSSWSSVLSRGTATELSTSKIESGNTLSRNEKKRERMSKENGWTRGDCLDCFDVETTNKQHSSRLRWQQFVHSEWCLPWILPFHDVVISRNHFEKLAHQSWIWIQFNIAS